jgi:hypothetical protein
VWLGGRCSGCLNDSFLLILLFFLGYSTTWKECIWLGIEHTSAGRHRHISFLSSFMLLVNTKAQQLEDWRSSRRVERLIQR